MALAIAERQVYSKINDFTGNTQYFYRMRVCPICGQKRQRCLRVEEKGETVSYICKYQPSDIPIETQIGTCWVHNQDTNKDFKKFKDVKTIKMPEREPITEEVLAFRTEVYNEMKNLLIQFEGSNLPKYNGQTIPLYKNHYDDLIKRGLSDEQILRMGYFSVPVSNKKVWAKKGNYKQQVTTAISKALYEKFGDKLLTVPGFIKLKDKFDNDYITHKTKVSSYLVNEKGEVKKNDKGEPMKEYRDIDGYFIPYTFLGMIESLQFRLMEKIFDDKGKEVRYLWYSSFQASSGSPIAHHIPYNLTRDDVLLITEGALKGGIASEKLGFEGLFEAGVSNYNNLMITLQRLEKLVGKKYKIILALDMDKHENPDVIKAEKAIISLLKSTGHQVAIAHWPVTMGKGIDDCLVRLDEMEVKLKEARNYIGKLKGNVLGKAKVKLAAMEEEYDKSKVKYKLI